MKATIEFQILEQMPLILHEQVSEGTMRGEPVELLRNIDSSAMYIKYKKQVYEVKTVDMIVGVLDAK